MNIENEIKVSVCVVTYNQENYIAECLESLINQVTNFKYEIIVGEDCSTDSTRAIVQSYVEKYPDLIVPLFYEKNVGPVENLKRVYKAAKGKYIAHMDGDDLALPNKLQKQFEILEKNIDCNICSHDVIRIDKFGNNIKNDFTYPESKYSLFDLYKRLPFFTHSSKMFRNKYSNEYYENLLKDSELLDLDLHIDQALDGDIYHIASTLGAYRVNVGVTLTSKRKINPALPLGAERAFEKGKIIFQKDSEKLEIIKKLYAKSMLGCAYEYAVNDGNVDKFRIYVRKSVNAKRIGLIQFIFELGVLFPRFFFQLLKIRNRIGENNLSNFK